MTHSQFLDSLSIADAQTFLKTLAACLLVGNPDVVADDYYWHSLLVRKFAPDPVREEFDLRCAAELDPNSVDVWVALGHMAMSQKQQDKAIAYYERGIQALPTNFFPWYGRAIAFMELGRFAEAMQDINRAISIHPRLAYGYEIRAQVYEKIGDLEHALDDANTAVDGNASRAWTHTLQRRIARKLAQRGSNMSASERPASLDIVGWAIKVAAWDSLLPIFVIATPFLVDRFAPNNRNLNEFVGLGIPIIACILRAIMGIWHILSNTCSAFVRTLQFCFFFVALFLLLVVDVLLIFTHQNKMGMPTREDCLGIATMMLIYLPFIAFAMYPGRGSHFSR
jgi:tetratricopeptide (TPR) repeat protein